MEARTGDREMPWAIPELMFQKHSNKKENRER